MNGRGVTTQAQPATATGPTGAKGRRSKRSRGEVENPDYAAFAARIIRAHGRRIALDIDSVPDLLRLAAELDIATQHAVNGLGAFGYSWGDIAGSAARVRQHINAGVADEPDAGPAVTLCRNPRSRLLGWARGSPCR